MKNYAVIKVSQPERYAESGLGFLIFSDEETK